MKQVEYDTALSRFIKLCNKRFGRRTKAGKLYGVTTEAAAHYGLGVSAMAEIMKHKRDKVMTEQMLQDIGLEWARVLVKSEVKK